MRSLSRLYFNLGCWPSIGLFFLMRPQFGIIGGSSSALIYCLFYTIIAMGFDKQTRLDFGITMFWFVGLLYNAAIVELFPGYFTFHFSTFLYCSLFLCAYLPAVFGAKPFTIQFAKRSTPKGFWQTDSFITTNKIMSLGWAGLFLLILCITFTGGLYGQIVIPVLMLLGVGLPLTIKFPSYYLKRQGIDIDKISTNIKPGNRAEISTGPATTVQPISTMPQNNRQRQQITDRLGPIKNALIIFGSPRRKKGHTYELLTTFIHGMQEGGIEVEMIDLLDYTIRPCSGCFSCWTKTPGSCIHQDDMSELLQKLDRAECVVYAQPLYVFTVPGIMKNFLDRSLPRLEPYLIKHPNGSTRHPRRWSKNGRMILFSVCGFPEIEHFDALRRMYQLLSQASGTEIVGEILRPASESLHFSQQIGDGVTAMEEALYTAGYQVATLGFIRQQTEAAISQPLFTSQDNFHAVANEFWDTWIRYESERRRGATELELQDYLDNEPAILFKGMASIFDKDKANDFSGSFQFNLQDGNRERFHITIDNGICQTGAGELSNPDIIINTPFATWSSIARGEIGGQEALGQGLYTIQGNVAHLTKFNEIFSRTPKEK